MDRCVVTTICSLGVVDRQLARALAIMAILVLALCAVWLTRLILDPPRW